MYEWSWRQSGRWKTRPAISLHNRPICFRQFSPFFTISNSLPPTFFLDLILRLLLFLVYFLQLPCFLVFGRSWISSIILFCSPGRRGRVVRVTSKYFCFELEWDDKGPRGSWGLDGWVLWLDSFKWWQRLYFRQNDFTWLLRLGLSSNKWQAKFLPHDGGAPVPDPMITFSTVWLKLVTWLRAANYNA